MADLRIGGASRRPSTSTQPQVAEQNAAPQQAPQTAKPTEAPRSWSAARRPLPVRSPFQPAVAVVEGHAITAEQVRSLVTPEMVNRSVSERVQSWAKGALNLEPKPSESPDAFQRRVMAEVKRTGSEETFQDVIRIAAKVPERQILTSQISASLLADDLKKRNIAVPAGKEDQLEQIALDAFARERKLDPASDDARAAFENDLTRRIGDVLWAPYQATIAAAFPKFSPQTLAKIRSNMEELFADQGVDAPRVVAQQLRQGGDAATIIAGLVNKTGGFSWSLSDLEAITGDSLQGVPKDPLERAATPIGLVVKNGELLTSLGQAPKEAVAALKAGTIVPTGSASARFQNADGSPTTLKPEEEDALEMAMYSQGRAIADGLRAGQNYSQAVAAAGLPESQAWVSQLPQLQDFAANQAVGYGMANKTAQFGFNMRTLGLPAEVIEQAKQTADSTAMLNKLHKLPPAFFEAIAGGQPIDIPLVSGAPLSETQRDTVAALQRYMMSAGEMTRPPKQLGEMDIPTSRFIQNLLGSSEQKSLRIDNEIGSRLVAAMGSSIQMSELNAGEQLLKHPAFQEAGKRVQGAARMDVALAYLAATGEQLGAQPWQDAPKFIAALERSAKKPLDRAAFDKAIEQARSTPLAAEDRDALLRARVGVVPDGANGVQYVTKSNLVGPEADRAAQALSRALLPTTSRTVPRGRFSTMVDTEPVAALKLGVAHMLNKPPPVNGSGVLEATMTDAELTVIANSLPSITTEQGAAWKRVIDGVRDGKVVISRLDPVPEKTQLDRDVNRVLSTLRESAVALKMVTNPTDAALAASSLQRSPYRPISRMSNPIEAARTLLAKNDNSTSPGAQLGVADLERLEKLHKTLSEKTPKEGGTEADFAARAFLKSFEENKAAFAETKKALAANQMFITDNETRATNDDSKVEYLAAAATKLFIQGADVLQTKARNNNDGLGGWAARTGAEFVHHLGRLPGIPDMTALNGVNPWMVLQQKMDMGLASTELNVPSAILKGQRNVDADAIRALVKSDTNPALTDLLRRMETQAVKPFTMESVESEKDADLKYLKQTARDALVRSSALAASTMSQIDGKFVRQLLEKHPTAFGQSAVVTAQSGASVELPSGDKAVELVKRAAAKLESSPWNSLNIELTDDAETRTAKALVQEALTRVHGKSTKWAGLPEREAAAAEMMVRGASGFDTIEVTPQFKSALVYSGFADTSETGALRDPKLSPALLTAGAKHARLLRDTYKELDPQIAQKMEDAAKQLDQAAQKGSYTIGTEPNGQLERSIRELSMYQWDRTLAVNELRPVDMFELLPGVTDLTIRRPVENVVNENPKATSLTDVMSKSGEEIPWSESMGERFSNWKKHLRFDPKRAAETALATTVQNFVVMPRDVAYRMAVRPLVGTGRALTAYAQSHNDEQRRQAMTDLGATWSEWSNLQAMMTAFITGAGFVQEVGTLTEEGKLDDAVGKGASYGLLAAGTVMGMKRLWDAGETRWTRNNPMTLTGIQSTTATIDSQMKGTAPTTARSIGAHAADLTKLAVKTLDNPKDAVMHAPFRQAARALRALSVGKTIDISKANSATSLSTTLHTVARVGDLTISQQMAFNAPDLRSAVTANPHGVVTLTLSDEKATKRAAEATDARSAPRVRTQALHLRGTDLMALGQVSDPKKIPHELKARLGLEGPNQKQVLKSLFEASRGLPPPPAATALIPEFKELMSPKNINDSVTWRVETASGLQEVTLKNSQLAELVKANQLAPRSGFSPGVHPVTEFASRLTSRLPSLPNLPSVPGTDFFSSRARQIRERGSAALNQVLDPLRQLTAETDPEKIAARELAQQHRAALANRDAFAKVVDKHGLTENAEAVRAVAQNYANVDKGTVASVNRQLPTLTTPDNDVAQQVLKGAVAVANTGKEGEVLFKSVVDSKEYVVQTAADNRFKFAVKLDGKDISSTPTGQQIISRLTATREKYGVLDSRLVTQLDAIEKQAQTWKDRIDSKTKLTEAEHKAFKAWQLEVDGQLRGELQAADKPLFRQRLNMEFLKAKVWAQGIETAMNAQGGNAKVEIVKSAGRTLSGAIKSPGFFVVVALEGSHAAYEIGAIVDDKNLSNVEKVLKSGGKVAGAVGTAVAAGAALNVAGRLLPWVGRALGVANPVGLAIGAVTLPKAIVDGVQRARGIQKPAEAIAEWSALGLPETAFLKADPTKYEKNLLFPDLTNDRATLERFEHWNRNLLEGTARTNHFSAKDSSMSQRVGQLLGGDDNAALKPRAFDPSKVKSFKEPTFPTLDLLENFAARAAKNPEMKQLAALKDFDLAKWKASVAAASDKAVSVLEDAGKTSIVVNEKELMELLYDNDRFAKLDTKQAAVVQERMRRDAEGAAAWFKLLSNLAIPAEQKTAAAKRFVENLAANHRVNSAMYEYVEKNKSFRNSTRHLRLDKTNNIDDYYLAAAALEK